MLIFIATEFVRQSSTIGITMAFNDSQFENDHHPNHVELDSRMLTVSMIRMSSFVLVRYNSIKARTSFSQAPFLVVTRKNFQVTWKEVEMHVKVIPVVHWFALTIKMNPSYMVLFHGAVYVPNPIRLVYTLGFTGKKTNSLLISDHTSGRSWLVKVWHACHG